MRVLLVGYEPEVVDFSDPALPPGLDAEKIRHGIQVALEEMRGRGWTAEDCLVRPDDQAGPALKAKLASGAFDCLVIGAGIRAWPRHLSVFERILNAAREAAPTVPIAFNTRPEDSAEAVERVCGGQPTAG
ncbi:hypothetical protein [Methylobacterium gregans]|uniref:Uncharacterized protein n=1 Tax=Methylobacterium gregans TaxID=374424 RepID=A0AA37HSI5_9HYPH|nr:hypothetical protein [Methylobacterium gregans]MDQ0518980.1 hypothetical protein [Methylobacterium gregans]GJD80841.1 hypothetical protein NBEOAGPD_4084 [Methylobacterium gregans]GLS53850.1 hypothetical protein GCM10007886_20330 [Methylobacterium gregans]